MEPKVLHMLNSTPPTNCPVGSCFGLLYLILETETHTAHLILLHYPSSAGSSVYTTMTGHIIVYDSK